MMASDLSDFGRTKAGMYGVGIQGMIIFHKRGVRGTLSELHCLSTNHIRHESPTLPNMFCNNHISHNAPSLLSPYHAPDLGLRRDQTIPVLEQRHWHLSVGRLNNRLGCPHHQIASILTGCMVDIPFTEPQ